MTNQKKDLGSLAPKEREDLAVHAFQGLIDLSVMSLPMVNYESLIRRLEFMIHGLRANLDDVMAKASEVRGDA
jgi:hypothetical protein